MASQPAIEHWTTGRQGETANVRLSEILCGIAALKLADDRPIGRLQLDSRQVKRGDVFVALPGSASDGRDYIPEAIRRRAGAVLYERHGYEARGNGRRQESGKNISLIGVDDLEGKLGRIASAYFRAPSSALQVIGVTGTNGKTTTTWLIAQALERLGLSCGYAGTLGTGKPGSLQRSRLTTMDVISIHRQLADFRRMRMDAVSLEVSSHGLDQGRVNGVEFDIAVLTNFSRDHLDYHHSMKEYARAKRRLFDFASLEVAVVNNDDAFGQDLVRWLERHRSGLRCLTYGLANAHLTPRNVEINSREIRFDLDYPGDCGRMRAALTGAVNVPNMLAAAAVLIGMGYRVAEIAEVMPSLSAPPGRMEWVANEPWQPAVVVDYAHTPEALEQALRSCRSLCCGKLVVVFGCGGDRDPGKRPQMGALAERFADRVIITDDNPRFESPQAIAGQIAQGMKNRPIVIHDRETAVLQAVRAATAKDLILLAGKGHETQQVEGNEARPLCDRDLVRELLERLS